MIMVFDRPEDVMVSINSDISPLYPKQTHKNEYSSALIGIYFQS